MEEPDNEECFPFWHQYKSTFGKLLCEGSKRAGIHCSSLQSLQSWWDYHAAAHIFHQWQITMLSNLSLCIAIVNLTLIYFQDYSLEFMVINIFCWFYLLHKMMIIMSLKRFSLLTLVPAAVFWRRLPAAGGYFTPRHISSSRAHSNKIPTIPCFRGQTF